MVQIAYLKRLELFLPFRVKICIILGHCYVEEPNIKVGYLFLDTRAQALGIGGTKVAYLKSIK